MSRVGRSRFVRAWRDLWFHLYLRLPNIWAVMDGSSCGPGIRRLVLDLLGYGLSDRPTVMDQPAEENPHRRYCPCDPGSRSCRCVYPRAASDRRHLIGYSWGTAICGGYTAQHPDKVANLVLSGALWIGFGAYWSASGKRLPIARLMPVDDAALVYWTAAT